MPRHVRRTNGAFIREIPMHAAVLFKKSRPKSITTTPYTMDKKPVFVWAGGERLCGVWVGKEERLERVGGWCF